VVGGLVGFGMNFISNENKLQEVGMLPFYVLYMMMFAPVLFVLYWVLDQLLRSIFTTRVTSLAAPVMITITFFFSIIALFSVHESYMREGWTYLQIFAASIILTSCGYSIIRDIVRSRIPR
jgi:hypothetical protein